MATEVVIKSWCDIEFDQDPSDRVDAETVTWFLYGTRMAIELCARHRAEITLDRMDEVVQAHGRVWEDPAAGTSGTKKRKRSRSRVEQPPVAPADTPGHDHKGRLRVLKQARMNTDESFTCLVENCQRDLPFESIQGLRMHQWRAHGIKLEPHERTK